MASIGRKIFFGFITLLLGIFAVFPLALFAVITFWIAVCYLALLVSFKGMGAIWRSFTQWRNSHGRNSPEAIAVRERLAARAQRIARAQSSPGSQLSNTPARSHSNRSNRTHRSNSNVSLSSLPQPDRDYEGVGGWLINRDNNGNASTSTFNTTDHDSQISVPIPNVGSDLTPQTFRRRSFGAANTGINSPELLTPSHQRHSNVNMLYGRPVPGPASPQSYFNNATAARSTTSVNSRRSSRVTVRVESEETPSDAENVLM